MDWSALAKIDWWRLVWMNLAIAALVGGTVFLFAQFVLGSPRPKEELRAYAPGPPRKSPADRRPRPRRPIEDSRPEALDSARGLST